MKSKRTKALVSIVIRAEISFQKFSKTETFNTTHSNRKLVPNYKRFPIIFSQLIGKIEIVCHLSRKINPIPGPFFKGFKWPGAWKIFRRWLCRITTNEEYCSTTNNSLFIYIYLSRNNLVALTLCQARAFIKL